MKAIYEARAFASVAELKSAIGHQVQPVILVEGTRNLPEADRPRLVELGRLLAQELPDAVFRTGNATGSDAAFAAGVAAVDPQRLELVVPYAGMGKARLIEGAAVYSLADVSPTGKQELAAQTVRATPRYADLIEKGYLQEKNRALRMKAVYLVRDALKVVGDEVLGLARATAGVFYVNLDDPMEGGTGHSIRVCRRNGVPVFTQREWGDLA